MQTDTAKLFSDRWQYCTTPVGISLKLKCIDRRRYVREKHVQNNHTDSVREESIYS